MKNKVILLLVALAVVATIALTGCGQLPPSMSFVAPGQTEYYVGNTLNLTGGKVVVYDGDSTQSVDLTTQMLDATTIPDFTTAGNYTIKGNYEDFEFSFGITVKPLPSSTAFVSPAKKVYSIGERVLNLTGSTVTIDGTTVEVTMDMLNASTLPNFNAVGDYTVTGTYQGYEFSFGIKVYSPYEFKHDADFVFTRAADVSKHVWMRETYADGTSSEWYNVTNNDFSVFELTKNTLHVELDMYVNNVAYNYAADFQFIDITGVSVSDLKNLAVGTSTYVNGILVAITTTSTRNEFILADKSTGEVISVSDLAVSGTTQGMTLVADVEVGDELIIPVTLTQADLTYTAEGKTWSTSDLGKLYGLYTGGKQLQTAVVSKGNVAPINYESATEITSQADLQDFLSATNRAGNVYSMVHFKGEMGFVWYTKASQLRMYFANGGVTSYETQKIDNVSPVFCEGSQLYTTGKTFREMVLSANYATTSYSTNPGKFLDIYALFIGGNGYYHKFVILSVEDAKPMEATMTNQAFTAPSTTQYVLNGTLDLTGATITRSYDIKADETIPVTADMLDAASYNMAAAGTYTVTGSYQGFAFSFEITVSDRIVTSIQIVSNPIKTTYTHREGLANVDLTGGKVRVNYSTGEYEDYDLDRSMLPPTDDNWAVGTVNYTVTYFGCTTTLAITYNNTAKTVTQILQETPDMVYAKKTEASKYVAPTNIYEVTGVVVRVITDYESPELLIREKGTNNIIGIKGDVATVGTYNAPALDTSVVKIGDEIALYVMLEKCYEDSASIGLRGKTYLRAQNDDFTTAGIVVLSSGNSTDLPLMDSDVTIIDSQEDLVAFLNNPNRFYTYVKFVGINFVRSDGKNQNMLFQNSVNTEEGARVNGVFPRLSQHNMSGLSKNTLDKVLSSTSGTYTSPASGKYDFYMLFVGGNSAAHHFAPLQDSWLLSK